jgi:LacI family transcriptional regulator
LTFSVTNEIIGDPVAQMRVTLRQIAAHLCLSRASISRGLRGDPRIPLQTRKRIRAAAEKMGYRPNALLSEMAAARWATTKVAPECEICYIDRYRPERDVGQGLPTNMIPALIEQALNLGYKLRIIRRIEFRDSLKLQRTLRSLGITDIILGPVNEKSLTVELDWNGFVCVQLLPGFFSLPFHSVVKDHFNVVTLAWTKAVTRGYERIGITLPVHPTSIVDDIMRFTAVHACQQHYFPSLAQLPPFRYEPGEEGTNKFLEWVETNNPDVIIGFTDFHYYFSRSKFERNMSYVSLHTGKSNRISGIPDMALNCAREAVNLLHYCRRTHQWGIPSQRIDHVVEPTWVEGMSLPDWKLSKDKSALPGN